MIEVRKVVPTRLYRIGRFRAVYIYRRASRHWELWQGWYFSFTNNFLGRVKVGWFTTLKEAMTELIRLQAAKVKSNA